MTSNRKSRVLLLANGGVSAKNTADQFALLNDEFYDKFVAFFNEVPRDIATYLARRQVTVLRVDSASELGKLIRNENIDLLNIDRDGVHGGEYIRSAHEAGVKAIVETNIFGYPDRSSDFKLVDYSIFPSVNALYLYIQRGHVPISSVLARSCVLYHGVDSEKFQSLRPSEGQVKRIREEFGIPESCALLLRVARPDTRKWGMLVLAALKKLSHRTKDVRLVCVGGLTRQAMSLVRALNLNELVLDAGQVEEDDLVRLFYSAEIFVHSSFIGETFGLVIAQAMMAGKPVVTYSTPWVSNGQAEAVDHGINGFVALEPQDYADGVSALINDQGLRSRLGDNALAKASMQYDAKRQALSLGKVFSEVLARKDPCHNNDRIAYYSEHALFPSHKQVVDAAQRYAIQLDIVGRRPDSFAGSARQIMMYLSDGVPLLRNVNCIAGGLLPKPLDSVGNFS